MNWIRISVASSAGSVPREAGTQMCVFADRIEGTIGGGALEWEAMSHARQMLRAGTLTARRTIPLGPALGQCCGGSVTLDYALGEKIDSTEHRNVWIYGAGHVGRALTSVMAGLPDVQITWVDTDADRFPDTMPDNVQMFVAKDPACAVIHAPDDAEHLILTYAHDVDLAICHALLGRSFDSVGLIGSATKWARFKSRLGALGHVPAQISRIACPIGDPSLGKHPQAIAIGVAAAMITPRQTAKKDQTA